MRIVAPVLLLLAALASPAHADILLSGSQHVGDGEDAALDPEDPVTRPQMRSSPSYFYLSQTTTITAVRVNSPISLDNQLQVFIDDMTTPRAGTSSGSCDNGGTCTYTLATPLTLAAGTHTFFIDGGCTLGGFAFPCTGGQNDFSFASVTLVSAQITLSRTFNRRTHLGDSNDANDNYGGRWYGDAPDGSSVSFAFTLEASRVVSEIRFHRLRDVTAAAASSASVAIDGVPVGSLTANGDPFSFSSGAVLAAGSHTLTVTAGTASGSDLDDVSWDDIVLVMINNPATTPGFFNAVDPGSLDVATGSISTQVAGSGVAVDLVAVSGGAQFMAYTGTLYYEIVDASNVSGSCATWPAATATFSAVFIGADSGRKTVSIPYAEALPHARIRMYDPALAITSCSTDNFAIRPHRLDAIVVSHADSANPGTTENLATSGFGASTQPVHKAGRYFTIQATAYNSANAVTTAYAGSPTLTPVASVLGANTGSAGVSGWTYPGAGSLRSDAAHYDEVGAVRLRLDDSTFAAVDADDPVTTNLMLSSATFEVGRFIPDHFDFNETTPAVFETGCGTFTYVGQPFSFRNPPVAQVIARSSSDTTTTNYDATLYKIAALPQSTYTVTPAPPVSPLFDTTDIPNPDNSFVNQGNGVSLFTLLLPADNAYQFVRTGSPMNPFDAQIVIAPGFTEGDNVGFETTNPGSFGIPGTGIPFSAGSQFRFGRMTVHSRHGSERMDLVVPIRAEYYSGGFQKNGDHGTCTSLAYSDLLFGGDLSPSMTLGALAAGEWPFSIDAPLAPGSVTIEAQIGTKWPWLRVGPNWDENPAGVATFGLSNDQDQRIFQREVISQ